MDGAPEPYRLTGTASVEIELTDSNDEPPNIEILIAQNGNLNSVNLNGGIAPIIPPGGKYQELVAFIEEAPSPDIVIAYVQVFPVFFQRFRLNELIRNILNFERNLSLRLSKSLLKGKHFYNSLLGEQ